ncbi:MAG: hypothetical protein M1838_001758 [Thelocarpon superellum]|nr:MAG: hypothetical protein M1838_001758 [Thelocarpon superellum]
MTATQQEAMKRLEKVRNATFVPKSFIYTVFHDLDTLFFRSVCRHRTYLTWSDMGRLCRDAAAFTMPILEGRGVAIRMAHKNLTTQWLPPPPPPRRPILPPELPFTLPPTWALEQAATEARHTGPTVLPALFYRALPPHLLNKPTFSRFDITAILLHEMIHAYLRIVCGTFDDALGDNGHGPSFVSILEALEDYLDPAFSMATQTNLETKATEAAAAEDEEEYEGGPKKKQKVEESTAETSLEHAKEILLAPWV